MRQEAARRATEEQIQAQRRQTEREKAEIERETIRVRALAEAEGRAHEAKLAEDVNRRMLVERANAEREKWVAAINTTFDQIGGIPSSSIFFGKPTLSSPFIYVILKVCSDITEDLYLLLFFVAIPYLLFIPLVFQINLT